MSRTSPKRCIHWQIPLVLLGLGIAVFSWGLQYKLSLYDPPQAITRNMPRAKLLSADEQAAVAASPLASLSKPPEKPVQTQFTTFLCFFVLTLASAALQSLARSESLNGSKVWLRRWFSVLNAFFFLPPPNLQNAL